MRSSTDTRKSTKVYIPLELIMEKIFKQDSTNVSRIAQAKDILSVVLRKIGYKPSIEGDIHQAVKNAIERNKEYINVNRQIYKSDIFDLDGDLAGLTDFYISYFNGKNKHLSENEREKIVYILMNIDYSNPKKIIKEFDYNKFKIPLVMIVDRLAKYHNPIDIAQLSLVKNELEFYTQHMFSLKVNLDTSEESIEELVNTENNYKLISKNPSQIKQLYPGIDHYYNKGPEHNLDVNFLKKYNPDVNDSKVKIVLSVMDNINYSIIQPFE